VAGPKDLSRRREGCVTKPAGPCRRYAALVGPRPENLKTTIETLRAELDRAMSDSDSLDQKALFVPGFTVGLAAVVLTPAAGHATTLQEVLVGTALLLAAATVVAGFRTLQPTATNLGPGAVEMSGGLGMEPADFDLRIVGSLVESVTRQTASNVLKSTRLWVAMRLAVATLVAVGGARLVEGF
jgi:hypothetical protein